MKLVSWNVNGLRACIQRGFLEQFNRFDADFFCLQETKLSEGQLTLDLPGYQQYWCYAQKKGYSGTAIFTKHTPLSVHYGLDVPELDTEGRLITLEYPEFYLLTCYTPNAQRELARIDHQLKWDEAFRDYIARLDEKKPVILCGDLNVAHQEIDLKNPKSNRGNAGFSDQERESFQKTLDLGFVDTFRHLHPDVTDAYSWWSYMFHAREKNAGWRIDYFLVSRHLEDRILRAEIHSDILGSDHCPVSVDLSLICNGGIWSPMSMGSAKIANTEEKTKEKDKAFAEKAKALLPMGLICLVLLALFLFIPSFLNFDPNTDDPTLDSDLQDAFVIHQYDQPLKPGTFFSRPGDITADRALLNGFTDGNHTFHVRETITESEYMETNCWLRLELLPEMIGVVDESWHLSLGLAEIRIEDLDYTWVLPYYGSDGKDIQGWLVFLHIPSNNRCNIQLHSPQSDTSYRSSCNLEYHLSTSTIVNDPCEAISLEAAPHITAVSSSLSSIKPPNLIISYKDGELYTPNDNIRHSITDAMYWIFVKLKPEFKERMGSNYTTLTTAPDLPDYITFGDYCQALTVYNDPERRDKAGWLIYGSVKNCDQLKKIEFSIQSAFYLVPVQTEHAVPVNIVITDWNINRMNTSYLLESLMRNPDFYKTVINSKNSSAFMYTLASKYCAFRELMWRNDAVQEIMNYTALENTSYRRVPYLLLNTPDFRSLMTTEETAMFITCSYPSACFTLSGYTDRFTPRAMDTNTLVKFIHTSGFPTEGAWLSFQQSDNQELTLAIYKHLAPQFVYLQELECRKEAMQWMLHYVQTDPREDSILPYLIEIWHNVAPEEPVVSVNPEITPDP